MSRKANISPRRRSRRGLLSFKLRMYLMLASIAAVLLAWAAMARQMTPLANTSQTHFDALIVLGTPADGDGNPTASQLERVDEAVKEFQRGVAEHIILSGGAAHNKFIEADVMARAARAKGVPESAIVEEPRAMDTIQNACYSAKIMKAHGWQSAEVISNAAHLPRAAMIFGQLPPALALEWKMQPSETDSIPAVVLSAVETLKTARYLVWARWNESCAK